MLYNDLKTFSLNSRLLFSVNGAVGVQIPIGDRFGATVGYRFRHILNAGQDEVNPGLNANIIVTGFAGASECGGVHPTSPRTRPLRR